MVLMHADCTPLASWELKIVYNNFINLVLKFHQCYYAGLEISTLLCLGGPSLPDLSVGSPEHGGSYRTILAMYIYNLSLSVTTSNLCRSAKGHKLLNQELHLMSFFSASSTWAKLLLLLYWTFGQSPSPHIYLKNAETPFAGPDDGYNSDLNYVLISDPWTSRTGDVNMLSFGPYSEQTWCLKSKSFAQVECLLFCGQGKKLYFPEEFDAWQRFHSNILTRLSWKELSDPLYIKWKLPHWFAHPAALPMCYNSAWVPRPSKPKPKPSNCLTNHSELGNSDPSQPRWSMG